MSAANEPPEVRGYSGVDAAADPGALVALLDAQESLAGLVRVKSALLDRLRLDQAQSALDVGCGLGNDVLAMARRLPPGGQATGLDLSKTMIGQARSRAAELGVDARFEVGDAASLPFADDSFDACRTERMLQHVADPASAVAEMVRVTRPGGRVAALDLDTGSLVVDHPDQDTTRIIENSLPDNVAQGTIGRQLPRLFRQAGLAEVEVAADVILGTFELYGAILGAHVSRLCAQGVLDPGRADRWWARLAELAEQGDFLAAGIMFSAAGTVPGTP